MSSVQQPQTFTSSFPQVHAYIIITMIASKKLGQDPK